MAEITLGIMEQVPVRDIWPHEERHFTPWLAENLHLLDEILDMNLELVDTENSVQGAGELDILARDGAADATVVIENQLEYSDDDHFARLIGYAATRDARSLIWVATGFWDWHVNMLEWLNQESGIKAYGIVVSVWRVGNSYAPFFELVAAPEPRGNAVSPRLGRNDPYEAFYQPLVSALREEGIIRIPRGRRGGWFNQWRAFETGYNDIFYGLSRENDGGASVYLQIETENRREIFDCLSERRDEIIGEMPGAEIEWCEYSYCLNVSVSLKVEDPTFANVQAKEDFIREWMIEKMVNLRNAIQPRLDAIMSKLASTDTPQ